MESSPGTWTQGPKSFSHQWYRCDPDGTNCRPIPGATGKTYTVTAEDFGHVIRGDETAGNETT